MSVFDVPLYHKKDSMPMRIKHGREVLVFLFVAGATGLACFGWFSRSDRSLLDRALKLESRPAGEIRAVLGDPNDQHSEAEYAMRRPSMADSYNPDPPHQVGFDYVLEYRTGAARLLLFFIKNEKVIHVYKGQT
jgi:hypothetical protein